MNLKSNNFRFKRDASMPLDLRNFDWLEFIEFLKYVGNVEKGHVLLFNI